MLATTFFARPDAAPKANSPKATRDFVRLLALRAVAAERPRLVCRWQADADGRLFCTWEADGHPAPRS
ncbi:MAG: hypothetical protein JOY64_17600 [Alphaproteobacteria bacterium]|nr:hypothetical protein [Alphaproteobacteria bacterium]MBV8409448.1 hypothetical protein [Alphaproteobacteria bacterium]